MRHIAWALFGMVVVLCGCSNELHAFCEESTAEFCQKCFECTTESNRYDACGFAQNDETACRAVLDKVCTSDGGRFTVEGGKSCIEQIEQLSCEELRLKGKPEVCRNLF